MKDHIRTFNYYWDLLLPFLMAATAIWFESPHSKMLIWAGWLVFVLHLTLYGQIKKLLWDELPTLLPYFILRIPLILLIPTFNDFLTVRDYFYAEVLGETVSILLILVFFMFTHEKNGEKVYKQGGLVLNLMVLGFLSISMFPFIAVIYEHFIDTSWQSKAYLAAILAPSLFYKYKLFKQFTSKEFQSKAIAYNDNISVLILIGIFVWFLLLGILYALKYNDIL